MGILGLAFTSAASGILSNAGQSQDNVIERAVSHVSKLGM
jgi:hypothetical protein